MSCCYGDIRANAGDFLLLCDRCNKFHYHLLRAVYGVVTLRPGGKLCGASSGALAFRIWLMDQVGIAVAGVVSQRVTLQMDLGDGSVHGYAIAFLLNNLFFYNASG